MWQVILPAKNISASATKLSEETLQLQPGVFEKVNMKGVKQFLGLQDYLAQVAALAIMWAFVTEAVVVSVNQAVDTITMQSEEPAAFTAINPASRGQPQATSAQGGHG
jgi:hypothetical protein